MKHPRIINLSSRLMFATIILWGTIMTNNHVASSSTGGEGRILFVNSLNEKPGDGMNWGTAYNSLITAIKDAGEGDSIWVASGIYVPTKENDRTASFRLKEGVDLYGGFSGGETRLDQRDWKKNRTVLSGDIGRPGYGEDNCYQVVKGADRALLDGFLVTGGNSINAPFPAPPGAPQGGGPGTPGPPPPGGPGGGGPPIHITPEIILKGTHVADGAGMINYQVAPIVRHCIFTDNQAKKGGAVYNMVTKVFPPTPGTDRPVPRFIDCIFENNRALGRGGGVANDLGTHAIFLNCVFKGNQCDQKGGGMYNDFGCSPFVINCLFLGNQADNAAAMGNDGASHPVIYYTTFTANRARTSGPSVYLGTGPSNNPALVKTIIWGNHCDWGDPGIYAWHDNSPRVEDSIIEGGYAGKNNSKIDPKLSDRGVSELDCGYAPESPQFMEDKLPGLLSSLKPYVDNSRAGPPRPMQNAVEPAVPISERVVYVNRSGPESGDGRQWKSAYVHLSDALMDASQDGAQIWVASGTYRPSRDDRSASFLLSPGIRLFGGFNGHERSVEQRNIERNRTILSGDIGRTKVPSDNCFHVLIGADGAVVDGFTITGGCADGVAYDSHGGGMINYKRGRQGPPGGSRKGYSPVVRHCIFVENFAQDGGAVYNYDRGKPRFIDCVFEKNSSFYGGAVLDRVGVYAEYQACIFRNNRSKWGGGALYLDYGSRPKIIDCRFTANHTSSGHGGAIFAVSRASQLEHTIGTFERCHFQENAAKGDGGGVAFMDNSMAELIDCSLYENQAGRNGGAIAVTGRSNLKCRSCDIEKNQAEGQGEDTYVDPSSSLTKL
jgi:hypothetical protein